MIFPAAAARQSEINQALREVEHELAQWIVHIRYDIQHDWSGEWGIFFKVVVTNAARVEELPNVRLTLLVKLGEKLNWEELGVIPYFNFRSQSEQEKMREPAWA